MFLALALILAIGAPAYAQGSIFSTLSGTVVDAEGLPIPGANVKVKNNGTGQEIDLVSGGDGGFTAPNINSGNYSVIVELAGFRTTTLEHGQRRRGHSHRGQGDACRSARSRRTSRSSANRRRSCSRSRLRSPRTSPAQQIQSLPLTSRNALDSLTSLAGFNTSGTARNSTVSGLPRSAINITLDGMSVQDNYLKTTDGYFARLSPLLDSVEEVTVTTAGNTADATGQGAVQIRFVTKAGTNQLERHRLRIFPSRCAERQYAGSAIATCRPIRKPARRRRPSCANTRPASRRAARSRRTRRSSSSTTKSSGAPSSSTLQRVILTPAAASGIFSYNAAGGVQQRNLLQIAAAQRPARDDRSDRRQDPRAASRPSTAQSGGVTPLNNPLVQQYTWSMPTQSFNPSPTMRLDYEVTRNHRLTGSFNYRHINSTPDTTNSAQLPFPNSLQTGSQQSTRWTTSESFRSTFGDSVFNEFRVGGSGGVDAVLAGVRDRHVLRHQRLSPEFQRRVLRHRRAADQLEPGLRPVLA